MPLIMDEDMEVDIDDLFGDGGGLSLPTRPPSKELYQRIDEMRASGCCQAIAWGKWGSIASIASNGTSIELRNLRSDPGDGSWALSEPTVTQPLTSNQDGGPLKHLAWSPTGSELAIFDVAGRVTVLSIFGSLNKPTLVRSAQSDPIDDVHAVVGCFWLGLPPFSQNRTIILHGPGIKEGTSFRYEASQAPFQGACHPHHSKSALLYVTANGMLRMLFPQNNNKWCEAQTELESVMSSDDLITHASICGDKSGTILIALATATKQLRIFRAMIDWAIPKGSEKVPPQALSLNPSLKTRHIAVTSWLQEGASDAFSNSQFGSSMAQLSSLEFLPQCVDANSRHNPPCVVTTRSHLPISESHYDQDVHTIIDRFELRDAPQNLHPAFEQISSRRNSVGSQPGVIHFLRKMEPVTINKLIVSMQPMNLGRVICFAYSDGSIDYRDRATMAEVFTDGDLDRVWHLSQIGFSYPIDEPCIQSVLSPSYCSLVQLRNNGEIKWKNLEYQLGDIGSSMKDAQYSAVAACLSLSCSTAVMVTANYDDILATAQKLSKPTLAYDWLVELSRILKLVVDYAEEAHYDLLIRNTTIQLCLSIQNSLGFKGEFHPRAFSGKFAWLVLQLRNIVVLVTMAANMKVTSANNEKGSPLEDPEVINSLVGHVRWSLDLLAWLIDALLTLPNDLPPAIDFTDPRNLSLSDLSDYLKDKNIVALHILLSSPTRGFLTALCRRLAHLDYTARKAVLYGTPGYSASADQGNGNKNQGQQQGAVSPELRAAYRQIAALISSTIIRIKTFETLLSSLNSSIKTAYASHSPPLSGSSAAEHARNFIEVKMLFCGQIPEALKGVIVDLFKGIHKDNSYGGGETEASGLKLLAAVREEIEPAKLFFTNFDILEVDDDPISLHKRKAKGMTVDCFRKGWLRNPKKLTKDPSALHGPSENGEQPTVRSLGMESQIAAGRQGARWRRCARCGAAMEEVIIARPALQWLVMQQRRCFCGGFWNTLAPGTTVA